MTDMLINLVEILSQCVCRLNHHVVYFNCITILLISYTSIKVKQHTLFFLSLFILRERERERGNTCVWAGEGREEKREFQAGSALSAQSPIWGLNSWAVKSWPESNSRVRRFTNQVTQALWIALTIDFNFFFFIYHLQSLYWPPVWFS